MSYPGVDLADEDEMNPVGTQDSSASEPQRFIEQDDPTGKHDKILVPQPEKPTPPKLSKEQLKAAVDEMFEVTDAWAPRQTKIKFKIDCPSGQTALVKHLDTMDLIEVGLIEELDFFTRRLFPRKLDPSGNPVDDDDENNETLWQALRDPEKRRRFFDMTGKLMAAAAIRPKIIFDGVFVKGEKVVFGYQLSQEERKEKDIFVPHLKKGETYAGAIDFADRMAFFHELNRPLKQIEPFRPESAVVLQDMDGVERPGSEAE